MTNFKKKSKFSLDEKIENTKFNFAKNLKWFLIAPLVIILVGVVLLCTLGFNLGLDFTGGTSMTVYIDSNGDYSDTTYDVDKDFNEIERVIDGVLANHGLKISTLQKTTMSDDEYSINGNAVIVQFQNDKTMTSDEISADNSEIRLELLKAFGFVPEDLKELTEEYEKESALVRNNETTTPSASAELMMRSFIALLVAVVIILIYVAIRFEVTSGLAAILALFHDLLVTASVVLICRIQINVAFIAALITILGYSINNTIIIFDSMRDKLKIAKNTETKINNNAIANEAVKQTMMRSVLTGLTTFVMIFFITVIGVADIREFAFPIMVGILAGFYSSVFLTPGLWAIAYRPRKRKKKTDNNKPQKQNKVEVVG